jgi:acyl dehydratase
MKTFEDFCCGEVIPLRAYQVTEGEMIDFAKRYDPQTFHTDPVGAMASPFGGLIASGWLTAAIFMRMQCDSFMSRSSCAGSPGVDEIRWLHPVRPGDILSGTNEVTKVSPSRSKPDRGTVYSRVVIVNQDATVVMTLLTRAIYLRRGPAESPQS